ncbi:hypothetical protein [Billgrantia montanilacus]|uniref:Uncharacterized protein n=1 Tax=Billgrantia montanilacus TaxID=2282305 RepID=A0A368U4F2_9GAMM|nr:hypothetical protein [Halomonas montanilacus]RCV91968.1 hypothetical protein DU505_02565 [Halomonas montanilacus]
MDANTTILAILDSTIQGALWAVLCFSLIQNFNLEDFWYLICALVLIVELGLLVLHQKITFPGIISYLGYEPNEKLNAMKKFNVGDHAINVVVMFVVVYAFIKV